MGTLLKPMARPRPLTALLLLPLPVLAQPANGPNRPATAAARPPRTKTRRCGSDTSWMVGLPEGFESSMRAKSLAMS